MEICWSGVVGTVVGGSGLFGAFFENISGLRRMDSSITVRIKTATTRIYKKYFLLIYHNYVLIKNKSQRVEFIFMERFV
jgi:hypothetical protein